LTATASAAPATGGKSASSKATTSTNPIGRNTANDHRTDTPTDRPAR
jgi:hypothetical protein